MTDLTKKYRVVVVSDLTMFGSELAVLLQTEVVEPTETYWWTIQRYALNVPSLWFKPMDDRLEIVVRKAVDCVMKREGDKANLNDMNAKANELFAKMIAEATKGDKEAK